MSALSSKDEGRKLLLVDGHYYAYRSFFAIRELSNSRGEPTNAIYGFIKALRRMLKDVRPDWALVVWDMGIPQRRSDLQPAYKQHREEMPDLMRPQLGRIQEILPLLGVLNAWLPDTEADDLMASYTTSAVNAGHEVVLATNDKDLFQLVNDKVRIYSTLKADLAAPGDSHVLLGEDAVRRKWGVDPGQIGGVLSLTGDSADNIPGVPGLGPKGAASLIQKHGSLAAILADPEVIANERVREKIRAAKQQIEENREMVRLDLDLPLPVPLEGLAVRPQYEELLRELGRCEFRSLLKEVAGELEKTNAIPGGGAESNVLEEGATQIQGELF
jgi:5'-3' exonuclease